MKKILLLSFIALSILACQKAADGPVTPTPVVVTPADAAVLWGQMTLKTMTRLTANTPTYASRALGFMGLTMYECVVNGSDKHKSMVGQLSDLTTLPQPETGKTYDWTLALNAGQATMLRSLYDYADKARQYSIDSLESVLAVKYSVGKQQDVVDRSIQYGKAVANTLFEWSKTDGGYQAYLKNFEPTYVFPKGASYWVPPVAGQLVSAYPLHPYWGQHRTFAKANSTIPVPAMPTIYSTDPNSAYFQQYLAVYLKSKDLSLNEKEIAAWWADDPSETFSPPGHSYSLATIVIKTAQPDLFKAAETYARVGMAVADGFVNCWKAKYTYHCERPSSYVRANMDRTWVTFWPEPPFPAFYSGHSVQAAASGAVLESLYGTTFQLTDNSHEGRPRDEVRGITFKPRTFSSFQAIAEEAAMSRFLGGIHTQQDNDTGLAEGRKIGTNINKLTWVK